MNFNASRNVGQAGGLRKAKRVSDVGAMGAPAPAPAFSPAAPFPPAGPPPAYQEGIQLDAAQDFGNPVPPAASYGFMGAGGFSQPPTSPAQLGSMLQQPIVQVVPGVLFFQTPLLQRFTETLGQSITDMAFQYGNQLAAQGRQVVERELNKYVPVSRLRYYFSVDTRYVMRKLLLICFPYTHKEWMVKYDQNTPVQPRDDINAPDLYIPCMGYVTYVLLAGFTLGLQHRFSPEQIGMQASSALAYIIFEMILYLVTLYITNTTTNLKTLDLLAFSGYKYTTMIASLLAGLTLGRTGYYCMLVYTSVALSYFLVKTLRLQLLSGSIPSDPPSQPYGYPSYPPQYTPNPYAEQWGKQGAGGTKRRLYFLLFVAITQPLLSWWLTYHLVAAAAVLPAVAPAR